MPNMMVQGDVECLELEFGSPEYRKSIDLRYRILREPLGLKFDQRSLDNEKDQFHLAAKSGGEIVGILLFKTMYDNDDTLRMRQVAVDGHLQGKGIGRKLLEFAENWAREKGYKRIELHARVSSLWFYLNTDYNTIGNEFEEIGIPHLKMEKKL